MPRGWRHRHRQGGPCRPGGKLSRFVEPLVLLALEETPDAHGYQLADTVRQLGMAESTLDGAAVYRALRDLEAQDCVASAWDTGGAGPARRTYQLTAAGRERLAAWIELLRARAASMQRLVERFEQLGRERKGEGDD